MVKSPKAKGSAGELEICRLFESWGREIGVHLQLERNLEQVRKGGADVNGVPGIEVEVKRQEALSVPAWWRQVCKAADKSGKVPLLAYRQNRRPWRFKVRQYVAIYGAHNKGTVEVVFEMDVDEAKKWLQYHLWFNTPQENN